MRTRSHRRTTIAVGGVLLLLLLCAALLVVPGPYSPLSWWSEPGSSKTPASVATETGATADSSTLAGKHQSQTPRRPKKGLVVTATRDAGDSDEIPSEDAVTVTPGPGTPAPQARERSQSNPRLAQDFASQGAARSGTRSRGGWRSGGGIGGAGFGGYGGSFMGGGSFVGGGGGYGGGASSGTVFAAGDGGEGGSGQTSVMLAYQQMGGGMPSGNTFYNTLFTQTMPDRSLSRSTDGPGPRTPDGEIDWNKILLPGADGCYGPFFSPLSAEEEALMLLNIEMGCENDYEDTVMEIVTRTSTPDPQPDPDDPGPTPRTPEYMPGPDGCYGPFFSPMGETERQLMKLNEQMGCGSSSSSSSSTGTFSSSSSGSTSSSGLSSSSGWTSSAGSSTSSSGSSTSSSGSSTSSAGSSTSSGTFTSTSGSSTSSSSSGGTVPVPGTLWLMLAALGPLGLRWARTGR